MKAIIIFLSGVLIPFLFLSCASRSTPSPVPEKVPFMTAVPVEEKPQWEAQWESALKAGKREGTVVIYGTQTETVRAAFTQNFKEKYGITVDFLAGTGSEMVAKILFQRKADLYQVDIFMGGNINLAVSLKPAGALDSLRPALILPEVADPKAWWSGQLLWLNPQDTTALGYYAYPSIPIFINTSLVKAEEVKSHWDLLSPKWKGKIVAQDPTIPGSASNWFSNYGYEIPGVGLDFMRQLAQQELVFTRDIRQHAEWVARGKYSIALSPRQEPFWEFKALGSPLQAINPTEGTFLTPGAGMIGLISKAPHPNASRVFINWFLSKEGQTIQSRAASKQSARLDVPTDFLNPETIRDPNVKYLWEGTEESALASASRMKVAAEIFGRR